MGARPRRRLSRSSARSVWACAVLLLSACDHYAAAGPPGQTPALSPAPPTAHARPTACTLVSTTDVSAVVETLRRADGSCVPASEAVVYRCDPAFDPVAEVGTPTGIRRFLGGAYAVPVDALPFDASEVGVTGMGRLWMGSGDASSLFVESGGRIERWVRLPDAAAISHPPSIFLIGDSILDGARTPVTDALADWNPTIDAEIGRPSSGGVTVAESLQPPLPDVVVVELGVNDQDAQAFLENAQRIVSALNGTNLLVWVTAHGPGSTTSQVNRHILEVVGPEPVGTIADWDEQVPLDELSSDGVHLLADHEGAFADFLAPVLRTWLDAVEGRGPTGCQDRVRAAIR